MVNYRKGRIYKIVSYVTDEIYIGSTCEPLVRRLAGHRGAYKRYLQGKKTPCVTSFKILETGDYEIVLIELYPCNSKEELHARERWHIDNTDCVNKMHPGRSKKEYNDLFRERDNQYRNEYGKQIVTCYCGDSHTYSNKTHHLRSAKHDKNVTDWLEQQKKDIAFRLDRIKALNYFLHQ